MKKTSPRHAILIAIILSFFWIMAPFLTSPAAGAARPRGPTEEQKEFASFVDGFMAGVQKERKIPGMAFVAVKDGAILYLKGYGVADLDSGAPVNPEKTLFRVGAISQPITAAAVMQLAERERIGLDEDVNVYLRRWKLPGTFEKPITPRHILTHTAGLDYKELEIAAPTSADERAYASKLPKLMPRRVSEPGLYYRESSMGYALLGSIVERYSRMNFDAAIKRYIFTPLGMTESMFAVASGDVKKLATGYDQRGRAVQYEYRYDLPASGMSTTAGDMGRFMLAQMSGGAVGRGRILGETHAGSMMRRQFSPSPMINGTAMGYLEAPVAGLQTLQRYGDMPGYSGFLMLIPEKHFGLFLAANASGIDFGDELSRSVAERFFPASGDRKERATAGELAVYRDIEGYYRTNMISRSTSEKILRIASDQIKISIDGGGITASHTRDEIPPTRWLPYGPEGNLFRRVGDDGNYAGEYMFFQRDAAGAVTALVMGGVNRTYDKLKPYECYYAQWAIIAGFAAAALLSFAGLFIGNAINKGQFPWEKGLSSDTELWGISSLFWAVQLAFAAGLATAAVLVGNEFKVFVPYQVKALFVIPLAGGLLLAWLWFRLLAKLLNPEHHWLEKITIITGALVGTGYMFFLAQWRLLGFMF